MLIPVGYKTHNKQYGTVENVTCPNCGKTTAFAKVKNKTTGTVIFIPVVSVTNMAYVQCTSCGAAYEVNKKGFNQINTDVDVLNAVYNRHSEKQQKQQEVRDKYSVGFSEKNQAVAVILAFLLTTLGAPFYYIGKPLYGVLCFVACMAFCALGFFPGLFAVVFGGFVLAFLIGAGKIKDGKGKYIASKNQQRMFTGQNR